MPRVTDARMTDEEIVEAYQAGAGSYAVSRLARRRYEEVLQVLRAAGVTRRTGPRGTNARRFEPVLSRPKRNPGAQPVVLPIMDVADGCPGRAGRVPAEEFAALYRDLPTTDLSDLLHTDWTAVCRRAKRLGLR